MVIRIKIDIKERYNEFKYALENLCIILGVKPLFTEKNYDLYIGNGIDRNCKLKLNKGDTQKIELMYYLLSGQEERDIKERDAHGRLQAANSILAKKYDLKNPLLNDYVLYFKKMFEKNGIKTKPFWKNEKKYAVLLTHDVDYAELHILPSILKLLFRLLKSNNSYKVLKDIKDVITGKNNYWHFDEYIKLEKSNGFRSAFYFAVKSNHYLINLIKRENEVTYNINGNKFKNIIKKLNKEGFEIGLHASYYAWRSLYNFIKEKSKLERILNDKIAGLRHHYWHLNPYNPEETWGFHSKAGFKYDCSLAFNEDFGYRRGLAFPFYPYDHSKKQKINLTLFPTCIMDTMLIRKETTVNEATKRCFKFIENVKKKNGLIVIDWHDAMWNTTFFDDVMIKSYINIINYLKEDEEVWVTTPRELSEWWSSRI